jgi:hypothetical protein
LSIAGFRVRLRFEARRKAALALTSVIRFAIVPPRVSNGTEPEEAKRMTLRTYKVSLYAFLFALAVGTAWAQEEKSTTPTGKEKWLHLAWENGLPFAGPMLDVAFWKDWSPQKEVKTFVTPIFEGGAVGQPIQITLKAISQNSGSCCSKTASTCEQGKCCTTQTGKNCSALCGSCSNCCKETQAKGKSCCEQCADSCECCSECGNKNASAEGKSFAHDWLMHFMPCPDPAFFLPWAMTAMPWAEDDDVPAPCPCPFAGLRTICANACTDSECCAIGHGQTPAHYSVEVKLVEAKSEGKPKVCQVPTVCLPEGGVSLCDCKTVRGKTHVCPSLKKDCVCVELCMEKHEGCSEPTKVDICKTCKVGKRTKIALHGNKSCWLEVCVRKEPYEPHLVVHGIGTNSGAGLTGNIAVNEHTWGYVMPPLPAPPATACCPPVVAVAPPMPYCQPLPPPAPVMQCGAFGFVNSADKTWTIHSVCEAKEAKLALTCCSDAKMCCDRMELVFNGGGSVSICPHSNQVAVCCRDIEALADSVSKTDHGIILKGHVRMCMFSSEQMNCSRLAEEAEISWKNGEMHFHCSWPKAGTQPSPSKQGPLNLMNYWAK